ncbi:MAG TPA: dihydroneopterin aldolase [Candidatus Limnocylindrales bacterium]|nr:dihydroneopterin aldolase [Candidatus Limnocylindrales bacterium]
MDRVFVRGILVDGRHGVEAAERAAPQPFQVDVELLLDLAPAGRDDDLERTADYAAVDREVRRVVTTTSFRLVEALAEAIAKALLAGFPAEEAIVRVTKPAVRLAGPFASAGVEIRRVRRPGDAG